MNVVPTRETKNLAQRMLHAARQDTGADAALALMPSLRRDQVAALVGVLLDALAGTDVRITAAEAGPPEIRAAICRSCAGGIDGHPRRGLCSTCYSHHSHAGTLERFPRRIAWRGRAA